jgi:DNA-binding MarR family transcriptional regulator
MKRLDKYDFYNENFETYFNDKIDTITAAQKSLLSNELLSKLFKGPKKLAGSLSFKEKTYILNTCFSVETAIYIYDPGMKINKSDLVDVRKANSGKMTNSELLENPRIQSGFVMSDKNLFQTLSYMNHIYTSEIYTLFRGIRHLDRTNKDRNYARGKEVIGGVTDLVLKYEQYKKRIIMEFDLTPQRLYVLLYFSSGEKYGKHFFQRDFTYAFNSTARMLSGSVRQMHDLGYLIRRGDKHNYKYTLSSKGVALLDKIVSKVIDNYLE